MVRYGVVGTSATAVDAGGYWLLTRGIAWFGAHYLVASTVSFCVSLVWGYAMHRRFTFRVRHGRHLSQFPRFASISAVGLLITTGVLGFGVQRLHLHDLLAKLLAVCVTALWNYTGQRLWTFRGAHGLSPPPDEPYTGPA